MSRQGKVRAGAGPEGEEPVASGGDRVNTNCLARPQFREYTRQELVESGALTISVEDCGRFLGVGRGAAYECVRNGEIPSLALGRKRLVPVPKLLQLLGAEGETDL